MDRRAVHPRVRPGPGRAARPDHVARVVARHAQRHRRAGDCPQRVGADGCHLPGRLSAGIGRGDHVTGAVDGHAQRCRGARDGLHPAPVPMSTRGGGRPSRRRSRGIRRDEHTVAHAHAQRCRSARHAEQDRRDVDAMPRAVPGIGRRNDSVVAAGHAERDGWAGKARREVRAHFGGRPGARHRICGGEHVARVVGGHTERRRGAGDGKEQAVVIDARADRPRGSARRGIGRHGNVTSADNHAQRRRRTGDRGLPPAAAERRELPGRDATCGIGRGEHVAVLVDGGAEGRRRAAHRADRLARIDGAERPRGEAPGRVGRGGHPAGAVHGHAQRDRWTGDAYRKGAASKGG